MNKTLSEQREHSRLNLPYPIDLMLYSPSHLDKSFSGFVKDFSATGACIRLEDRYHRFELIEKKEARIELEIEMPLEEGILINSRICWIKSDSVPDSNSIMVGLEFKKLEDWQLKKIDRLARIRKKDSLMINDLFDYHLRHITTIDNY